MKIENKSRLFKILGGSVLAFIVAVSIVFVGIAAKNLSADLAVDVDDDGDFAVETDDFSVSTGGGNDTQPDCGGSNCLSVPGADEYKGIASTGSFRTALIKWTNFFLGFLTLIAMIAMIYAGFLYITAMGNDEQAKKAKNIVVWVVLGIIIILLAFALVNTIITTGPTGSDLS